MKKIEVRDLSLGDIDARHEILSRDHTKRQLFLDAFTAPPSFELEQLVNGDHFLICGPKGSGKTAFLRFLHNHLDANNNSMSRFIVFRDDVTTQDREKLVNLSQFRVYTENGESDSEEILDTLDCLSAWQLFIHREIAQVISRSQDFVAKTNDVHDYVKLLGAVFSQFRTSGFKQMLQKITRGRIKLGALGNSLEAEVEFIDKHGNIDVSEFVRYCNSVVADLDFNAERENCRINIFFDELNINFVTGRDFKKNSILIRDLVAACGAINLKCAEAGVPVFVYTAIRAEVADAVESNVRELQKWLDDKAVFINWITTYGAYEDQPIINLLTKRIAANEKRLLGLKEVPTRVSLLDYFDPTLRNLPFTHFLLFETWGRPRDLVRLLSAAADFVEPGGRFSTRAFIKSADKYSRSCWEEKQDELNAKYSQSMAQVIKKLFLKFETSFSRQELDSRITFLSNDDPRVNQFFKDRNIDTLLEDLYKVGIIGNIVKTKSGSVRPQYLYFGHHNFDSRDIMCVHKSLWRELSLDGPGAGSLNKKKSSIESRRH